MNKSWTYSGRELEYMAAAVNYRRWILERLSPYLGERIVEVGAGDGSFSRLLLERKPKSFMALEPSANLYRLLVEALAQLHSTSPAQTVQATLADTPSLNSEATAPDTIVYINVLEHVEDDRLELRLAHSVLGAGGRILVFVPAHDWLMSPFDRKLGHFRRYTRAALISKFETAGFTIRRSEYFDILGILPWWLKYRVLQSGQMESGIVRAYDRWGTPLSRALDAMTNFRMGKNVIVIGEKKG